MNVAVTVTLFSTMTVQIFPAEELQLVHPPKVDEPVGAAVRVAVDPAVNELAQAVDGELQLIAPETIPVPCPARLTVRIGCGPGGVQPRLAGPYTVICA